MATLARLEREVQKLREQVLQAQQGVAVRDQVACYLKAPERVFAAVKDLETFRPLTADPWQVRFLRDRHPNQMMLCSRRAGKSRASAAKTLLHCLATPNRTALIFCPTLKQAHEYMGYVKEFNEGLGRPYPYLEENKGAVRLANGSRVVCLPDNPRGVVGFTPTRLVIDEAAKVSDELYLSVRPMLALGNAECELLSTPYGKRGFFFGIYESPQLRAHYRLWQVTADHVPRITPQRLALDRAAMGERAFRQEYFLEFVDAVDAYFSQDAIRAAASDEAGDPWF